MCKIFLKSHEKYVLQKGGGHTGLAPNASFMGSGFADFALKGADKWLMIISDWLKLGKQVIISIIM